MFIAAIPIKGSKLISCLVFCFFRSDEGKIFSAAKRRSFELSREHTQLDDSTEIKMRFLASAIHQKLLMFTMCIDTQALHR